MNIEIIHGPESYAPENYLCKDADCHVHGHVQTAPKPPMRPVAASQPVPEVRGGFSEVFSTKHEKILLRVDHIERMDAVRKAFNKARLHSAEPPLTTSDIVNACLDFVFQHRIAFSALKRAQDLPKFIAEHTYRDVLSRWRQWTEAF